MALDDFLLPGEQVLAGGGQFYATDRRLLRYSRLLLWQQMDEVSYPHLLGLPLVIRRMHGLLYAGIIVLLLAAAAFGVTSLLGTLLKDFKLPQGPLVLGLLLGIVLILVWLVLPVSYYQVRALGVGEKEAALWRIGGVRSANTKKLVATIQERRWTGQSKGSYGTGEQRQAEKEAG